jgi:hypothetical protein
MIQHGLLVTTILVSLAGCSAPNTRVATKLNETASIPAGIAIDPLKWKVITSAINANNSTMSTLYGNDLAVQYARTTTEGKYPAGSVLSLVTWRQQEDRRWFGAAIPAEPKSVEILEVSVDRNGKSGFAYRNFEGSPLQEARTPPDRASDRIDYIRSRPAAVMP